MTHQTWQKVAPKFDGYLLKKSRFFGWKKYWVVLDNGIISWFAKRFESLIMYCHHYNYFHQILIAVAFFCLSNKKTKSYHFLTIILKNFFGLHFRADAVSGLKRQGLRHLENSVFAVRIRKKQTITKTLTTERLSDLTYLSPGYPNS